MRHAPLLFVLLAIACRSSGSRSERDSLSGSSAATRADSAGWRFAYLPGAAISLRYPVDQVRGVRDEWTPTCDHPLPLYADEGDTSVVDRIILRAAPAPFDSAVAIAGFFRYGVASDTGYLLQNLHGASGSDWADTITAGPWRALAAVITDLSYLDDADSVHVAPPPKGNPDATMPPSQVFSRRIAAVGPMVGRCLAMLVIETHTVVDPARAPLDSAVLRSMLAGFHQ